MRSARGYAAALVALAAGAALALLASGRSWATATVAEPGAPAVRVALSGGDVAPAVGALALVALAGVVAVPATRGRLRRVVGGVLALCGIAVVAAAWGGGAAPAAAAAGPLSARLGVTSVSGAVVTGSAWWVVAAVGGLLIAAAGALTASVGPSWTALSRRYDAGGGSGPGAPDAPQAAHEVWAAFDRGEDPTDDAT